MLLKKFSILGFFILISSGTLYAQVPCTALGQNPSTAFPVCGTSVFHQDSVPICSSNNLYVPGCSIFGDTASNYKNKNPFWYKFTCFKSGTLSFLIIPNLNDEDYDWQLYDITGHNPDDVYTDTSLIVAGNWAGTYGPTGANDTGVHYLQCASFPTDMFPTFAFSPDIFVGHNYLLLISHFSDTKQGYSLSFGGGTAVITDTLPPHILHAAITSCSPTQILVKLNKKMKCSTLAANGSDFILSPPAAAITSATGMGCTSGFDMDSVLLTFSQPLPLGNYNLVVKNGTDANTLLDICDKELPVGEAFPFTVLSPLPVPMDSLNNNKCRTDSIQLIFPSTIQCSTVAPNGSDFFITGPYPINIISATPANCIGGLTNRINVRLSAPMEQPGNFQIILRVGADGNTILSECDTPSVAGSAVAFNILHKPLPNFGIPATICLPDGRVTFTNLSTILDGTENLLHYRWNFNDPLSTNNFSTLKSPTHIYSAVGPYLVGLQITSSGGCAKDTAIWLNTIHPQPKANFGVSKPGICIGDILTFTDSTNSMDGITVQWNWNLGDGTIRNTRNVANYVYDLPQTYKVTLFTVNSIGCNSDTVSKLITVHPYPVVNAGPDRVVLEGGQLTINAIATGTSLQYVWTPPLYLNDRYIITPKCIGPKDDITYTVSATNQGGCKVTDEMFVKVLKMPRVPNTFTPNNDGTNDFWQIQYIKDYPNSFLQVFTRAGQKVYECRGLYRPWNGTYNGKSLPFDTYYYILEPGSGRDPLTGYVTIIR